RQAAILEPGRRPSRGGCRQRRRERPCLRGGLSRVPCRFSFRSPRRRPAGAPARNVNARGGILVTKQQATCDLQHGRDLLAMLLVACCLLLAIACGGPKAGSASKPAASAA